MNLTIEVNNNQMYAAPGDTILDVLNRNGMSVPTLCHMKGLFPTGSCRMCVVEVHGRRNLVTACSEPVTDGMKISTHSARVVESRKTIVEAAALEPPRRLPLLRTQW
jgi:NADH dehydrogenase/NADH:ubiquinone oxidoreductase subunit G